LSKNQNFPTRLRFALNGIRSALKNEHSFRAQFIAAITAIVILILLRASLIWLGIFILIIALILSFELMNTALENFIDHLHPNKDPKIGLAKDCAAGAVLILCFASVILFFIFLLDRFAFFKN